MRMGTRVILGILGPLASFYCLAPRNGQWPDRRGERHAPFVFALFGLGVRILVEGIVHQPLEILACVDKDEPPPVVRGDSEAALSGQRAAQQATLHLRSARAVPERYHVQHALAKVDSAAGAIPCGPRLNSRPLLVREGGEPGEEGLALHLGRHVLYRDRPVPLGDLACPVCPACSSLCNRGKALIGLSSAMQVGHAGHAGLTAPSIHYS